METGTALLIVVGGVVVVGGIYLATRPPPAPAYDSRVNISGAADAGQAERTAWVGMFGQAFQAAGSIANAYAAGQQGSQLQGGEQPSPYATTAGGLPKSADVGTVNYNQLDAALRPRT